MEDDIHADHFRGRLGWGGGGGCIMPYAVLLWAWVCRGPSCSGFVGLLGFVEDLESLVNDLSGIRCLLHGAYPHGVVATLDLKPPPSTGVNILFRSTSSKQMASTLKLACLFGVVERR